MFSHVCACSADIVDDMEAASLGPSATAAAAAAASTVPASSANDDDDDIPDMDDMDVPVGVKHDPVSVRIRNC
jgi:hypothetical protein